MKEHLAELHERVQKIRADQKEMFAEYCRMWQRLKEIESTIAEIKEGK